MEPQRWLCQAWRAGPGGGQEAPLSPPPDLRPHWAGPATCASGFKGSVIPPHPTSAELGKSPESRYFGIGSKCRAGPPEGGGQGVHLKTIRGVRITGRRGVHLGSASVPGSQAGHTRGMQLGTESAGRGAGSSLEIWALPATTR